MILASKRTFYCILLIFSSTFLFAQNIPQQDFPIQHFILENGLSLFVIEDASIPIMSVRLQVKAGYSQQTTETSGFFDVYTRMFFSGSKSFPTKEKIADEFKKNNIIDATAQCTQEVSFYQLKVPFFSLENALMLLADCAANVRFSEVNLLKTLSEMQIEVKNTINSSSGFMNHAINARMFLENPEKHEYGFFPAVSSTTSLGTARARLNEINKMYVPENSALFICGNLAPEVIYQLVNKTFGTWKNEAKQSFVQKKSSPKQSEKPGIYVLASDKFSKDFTQIMVQYKSDKSVTEKNKNQRDEATMIAANLFENTNNAFKQTFLENAHIAIPSEDYIHSSVVNDGESSRLIIQGLMERNSNGTNPLLQANEFLSLLKNPAVFFTKENIIRAKQNLTDDFIAVSKSSFALMEQFAQNWAHSSQEDFFLFPQTIQAISQNDLLYVMNRQPFVFVLVHTSIFLQYQKDFQQAATEIITEKNIFTKTSAKNTPEQNSKNQLIDINNFSLPNYEVILRDFIQEHTNRISFKTTANGISTLIRKNTANLDASIKISFLGGDLYRLHSSENYEQEYGFETLAVTALSKLISLQEDFPKTANIFVETTVYANTIVITVESEKILQALSAASRALQKSAYTPQIMDQAIWETKHYWRSKNVSNEQNLYQQALQYLFAKTSINTLLFSKKDLFSSIQFAQILAYCKDLQNPSRIQCFVTANLSSEKVYNAVEKNFAFLPKAEKPFPFEQILLETKNLQPDLSKTQIKLPIDRIFTSNLDGQNIQKPNNLIPTKSFKDPVYIFFNVPVYGSKEFAQIEYMMWNLTQKLEPALAEKNPEASLITLFMRPNIYNIGYLAFSQISNPADLQQKFSDTMNLIKKSAKKDSIEDQLEKKRFMTMQLANLEREDFYSQNLQNGLNFAQNPLQFLNDLEYLSTITWNENLQTFLLWLENVHFTWFITENLNSAP